MYADCSQSQRAAIFSVLALVSCAFGTLAHSESSTDAAAKPLVVGVRHNPPFTIRNDDGSWRGLSVDIWTRVAEKTGIAYTFRETTRDELNNPKKFGIDVAPNQLIATVSEEIYDLTAPYYGSGLGVAMRDESRGLWEILTEKLRSRSFLESLLVLALVMAITGTVVWLMERNRSPDEFGGSVAKGIGNGIFWAVESLFGKSKSLSRTIFSRIFALGWMGVCVLVISGVTAKLSSELTFAKLGANVSKPDDLRRYRVGSAKWPSSGALFLNNYGITFTDYEDTASAIKGLAEGKVDVVIAYVPYLTHYLTNSYPGSMRLLPVRFQSLNNSIGLPLGSPLRKQVNLAILEIINGEAWPQIVRRYLPDEG